MTTFRTIRQFLTKPYLYVFIVLMGISFKFYHLDYKLFWLDEICTIQHTSGIPDGEYPALVPINEIKNIDFYHDLYRLNKQPYTITSELKGLFSSRNLNPLHYSFLMVWYRVIGDDPVDFRLFGVFVFLLISLRPFRTNWLIVGKKTYPPILHNLNG